MNNLYGYAMSEFLPKDGCKKIDPIEFDLNKYSSSNSEGCDLKCNLTYPKKLDK